MSNDHRYWFSGVGPYPSVTTVLGVLDKPALIEWAKRTVAEAAVLQLPELTIRVQADPDAARKWLAGMPGYQRDTAANLGTSVHLLADMVSRGHQTDQDGFQIPDGTKPYLEAFRRFLVDYGASSIVSSEKAILNFSHGYGGTYDLLMTINDELWLVDIKTSRFGFYPETGLQLSAYQHGEFIVLENDPVPYPMPAIQRCAVLHLRPDAYPEKGYRFVEYQVREQDFDAFIACRAMWQWRQDGRFKSL
jgi:hypothetical protein